MYLRKWCLYFVLSSLVLRGVGVSAESPSHLPGSCAPALESEAPSVVSRSELIFNLLGDFWDAEMRLRGLPSRRPKLSYFTKYLKGPCGAVTLEMGPQYCPGSQTIYLDPAWYQLQTRRTGVPAETIAVYVLAHEYGHHVTQLTGLWPEFFAFAWKLPMQDHAATSRMNELTADALAGFFAGQILKYKVIEDMELSALTKFVCHCGDDYVGGAMKSHGTGIERQAWFRKGMRARRIEEVNAFLDPELLQPMTEITRKLITERLSKF